MAEVFNSMPKLQEVAIVHSNIVPSSNIDKAKILSNFVSSLHKIKNLEMVHALPKSHDTFISDNNKPNINNINQLLDSIKDNHSIKRVYVDRDLLYAFASMDVSSLFKVESWV